MFKSEDYVHFWIDDDILHVVYKPNTVIDLKAAESIVRDRIRFQNGRPFLILCDLRQLKTVTKPARDYLAMQGSNMALAVALIVEKSYSGKISKIFINTSQPSVPTREFTEISKALDFLNSYLE
jgi:hypothetical protein